MGLAADHEGHDEGIITRKPHGPPFLLWDLRIVRYITKDILYIYIIYTVYIISDSFLLVIDYIDNREINISPEIQHFSNFFSNFYPTFP